jgi:hypothetical protein
MYFMDGESLASTTTTTGERSELGDVLLNHDLFPLKVVVSFCQRTRGLIKHERMHLLSTPGPLALLLRTNLLRELYDFGERADLHLLSPAQSAMALSMFTKHHSTRASLRNVTATSDAHSFR